MKKFLCLFALLLLCIGAGFGGSLLTTASVKTWYPTINKPSWNPPDWIFAPVWTTLFILMAISAWLVFEKKSYSGKEMLFFIIQLTLNILWSYCFFYLQNPSLAFAEILILLLFILVTMIYFTLSHFVAGLLFLPYFLWVSFAAFLNYTIWTLN